MSLINKMLQDLDARGGAGDAAVRPQDLKAVPAPERDRRPLMLAGAGAAVVALAAGGWYGWQYWQGHRAAPVPTVVINQIPPGARVAPAAAPVAEVAASAALTAEPLSASKSESMPESKTESKTASLAESLPESPSASRSAQEPQSEFRPQTSPVAAPMRAARSAPLAVESAARPAVDEAATSKPRRAASETAAPRAERKAAESEGVSRRELTPKQESDSAYRHALAALQEGRLSVALADLERALEVDPRNEGARQTYVSLLLENKRTDEAIRQLRLALGIDPRQPGLAMVLARLQLERGGPALDTLMKTLPHAGGNADYQAFLAGVLQREQRHAEAARYYRDALRLSPNNGVWWMGLGISLQADQHLPEARDAYTRARAASGMTAELLAFIDRKLELLAR